MTAATFMLKFKIGLVQQTLPWKLGAWLFDKVVLDQVDDKDVKAVFLVRTWTLGNPNKDRSNTYNAGETLLDR